VGLSRIFRPVQRLTCKTHVDMDTLKMNFWKLIICNLLKSYFSSTYCTKLLFLYF